MADVLSVEIPFGTEWHQKVMTALWDRYQMSYRKMTEMQKNWRKAEEQTIGYLPEGEIDAIQRQKKDDGIPSYVTMHIPYSYALLMTAHTYATSTLLSRDPIFQYMARHGRVREQEQAVEALVAYNVQAGKHLPPYYIWLYDSFKYGIGILGNYWVKEEAYVPRIEYVQDVDPFTGMATGKRRKEKVTEKIVKYHGNKVFNVRPYHFFPDTRKPIHRFQEGEFCGVYLELGWNEILRREARGEYFNIEPLRLKSKDNVSLSYLAAVKPEEGVPSPHVIRPDPSMVVQSPYGGSVSSVGLLEMVVELVPKEWKLGSGDYPEKWLFTFDVGQRVIIGCRPFGCLHDQYPYVINTLEPEGYNLVSRGLMEIVQPLQDTLDWLVNSHFYNIRQILNNTILLDPSRVIMSDVLSGEPGGIWRLSPAGYGQDPRTIASQFQVGDVTQQHLQDMKIITDLMQRTTGIIDGLMGMPQSGGRKTATEVRQANSFSVNRLKTVVEWFSAIGVDRLSQMLLSNCQQFYDEEMELKIAGDLLGQSGVVKVTPDIIMGQFDFVPVDGAMPADRYAQANLLREMLTEGIQVPGLLNGFDVPGIFTYIMQLAGIKNINQFRVQPKVMMPGEGQPPGTIPVTAGMGFDPTQMIEPGQLSGMGQTA